MIGKSLKDAIHWRSLAIVADSHFKNVNGWVGACADTVGTEFFPFIGWGAAGGIVVDVDGKRPAALRIRYRKIFYVYSKRSNVAQDETSLVIAEFVKAEERIHRCVRGEFHVATVKLGLQNRRGQTEENQDQKAFMNGFVHS